MQPHQCQLQGGDYLPALADHTISDKNQVPLFLTFSEGVGSKGEEIADKQVNEKVITPETMLDWSLQFIWLSSFIFLLGLRGSGE